MPKFLIPILGILVAITVGIAAAVVGIQFAAPHTIATQSAPVLAPIAQNASDDGDPETLAISEVVGTTEIVTPGQQGTEGLGAELEADIEVLNAADGADPGDAHVALGEAPPAPGLPTDDPCAPESGETPAGCPSGLRSVILADSMPPALELWATADPPTAGSVTFCPASTAGDGQLQVGVATTTPAAVTVRYWPQADPSAEKTLVIETPQSELDAWNADNAAVGGFRHGFWIFQHCDLMTDLLPDTSYVMSVTAADVLHRLAGPIERIFDSRGAPTEPPMTAIPLSPSVLYVSVPTDAGRLPAVRAWVVPGGTTPNCQSFDAGLPVLRTVQDQVTVDVSAEYLALHNYQPSYTKRVVNVYSVPEGSQIVVCARWFSDSGPSWTDSVPTMQRSITASSPDTPQPVLTLLHIDSRKDLARNQISIGATTQMGLDCGSPWVGPGEDVPGETAIDGAGWILCDASSAEDYVHAQLSLGRTVVITSRVTTSAGETSRSFVVPTPQATCTGVCDLPAPTQFTIPLADVTVGTGICGYNFWEEPCTPPTTQQSLGTATVELSWVQGSTSALHRWEIGGVDLRLPESTAPDAPAFDAGIYPVGSLSPDGWTSAIEYNLTSDRHARYTVTIIGDCFGDTAVTTVSGETRATTGSAIFSGRVRFDDLCPGSYYYFAVDMVDDAGHRTTAGSGERTDNWVWWPGYGGTFTPKNVIPLTTTVAIDAYRFLGSPDFYAQPYRLTVADQLYNQCKTADDRRIDLTWDTTIDQQRIVHISIPISAGRKDSERSVLRRGNPCTWLDEERFAGTFSADVSYSDLLLGTTLTGYLTQSGYGTQLPEAYFVTVHVQWPGLAGATRVE